MHFCVIVKVEFFFYKLGSHYPVIQWDAFLITSDNKFIMNNGITVN